MSNKDKSPSLIDIREDDLLALSAEVLDTLLRDHTTGRNIFWATHDYEALGPDYDYHSEILPHLITGEYGMVIRPRVLNRKNSRPTGPRTWQKCSPRRGCAMPRTILWMRLGLAEKMSSTLRLMRI